MVLTTCDSEENAAELARGVVEAGLAACGTLLPGARSIYTWKGAVLDAREVVLLLKTTPRCAKALAAAIRARHTYTTPEIIVFNAGVLNPDYDLWLRAACRPKAAPAKRRRRSSTT